MHGELGQWDSNLASKKTGRKVDFPKAGVKIDEALAGDSKMITESIPPLFQGPKSLYYVPHPAPSLNQDS